MPADGILPIARTAAFLPSPPFRRKAEHGRDRSRRLIRSHLREKLQALEHSRDIVFRNTDKDIEFVLRTLGDAGARLQSQCYDTADLYNL